MIELTALQYIYTYVGIEHSPKRKEGLQSLFYSKNLSSGSLYSEEYELKNHAGYSNLQEKPLKWEYFRLETGKFVVSRTCPLNLKDSSGRGGLYLNHCLIFSEMDWRKIGCNPFRIIDHFSFFTDPMEVLNFGNLANGSIPDVTIMLPEKEILEDLISPGWDQDQLVELGWLAFNSKHIVKEKSTVFSLGKPDQAFSTLRMLFSIIPPSIRCENSFNTFSDSTHIKEKPIWAGLQEKEPYIFIPINPEDPIPRISIPQSDNPLFIWWQKEVPQFNSRIIASWVEDADNISAFLKKESNEIIDLIQVDNDLLISFKDANKEIFHKALRRAWDSLKLAQADLDQLNIIFEKRPVLPWLIINNEQEGLTILAKTICDLFPQELQLDDQQKFLSVLDKIAHKLEHEELLMISGAYRLGLTSSEKINGFYKFIMVRLNKKRLNQKPRLKNRNI